MPSRRSWGGTSRLRLTVIFLVVMLPPGVTLVGLGLWLLDQNRALQAQRETESRGAAADNFARVLRQLVASAELWSHESQVPENVLGINAEVAPAPAPAKSVTVPGGSTLQSVERDHILQVLEETKWLVAGPAGAAAKLGMKRTTLQAKMRKLGISRRA